MYFNYGSVSASNYQNAANGSNYQNATNGSNSNGSRYQNAANGSSYQNAPNGSNNYRTASQYPINMSTSQRSGGYPGCGFSQRCPTLPVAGVDAYSMATASLPANLGADFNQAHDFMNYSTGTKVNHYSTETAYDCNKTRTGGSSTTRNSDGDNLMTSQSRSKLPMSCWTNEELLAVLTTAEAEELLASVDAELAAKKLQKDAAAATSNGTTSDGSNHSHEKSIAGSQRCVSYMQQPASTHNYPDNSSIQFDCDRGVSTQMDIHYLPSCQFSNQPSNSNNRSLSNLQTQSQPNGDIRIPSQQKMMPGYQYKGQHSRGQEIITAAQNTDTIFRSDTIFSSTNPSKQLSLGNYDFSQAFNQGVSSYNFTQTAQLNQDVSNYIIPQDVFQGVSNQTTYPTSSGVQSCSEVIQPLNIWTPTSISSTQAHQRPKSNSGTNSTVHHKATPATSRKISSTARDAMMAWFEENKHHPYPDPDEYRSFVAIGGTTYSQAVKWFANRRKRTGTCKTIPEYVQGRRMKPVKPAEGNENAIPVNVNRKRSSQNDNDNIVGQPKVKKSRKM